MTILIVDDESSIRDLLGLFLTHNGYTVATAVNGAAALQLLEQSAELPELILLDLMMPMMNGLEFRDAQRQTPALAGIPVAVISAAENIHEKTDLLDADAYLDKPIDFAALLATAERFCEKGRAQGQ